jgi:polyisoprenoid-binding protein YceI
MSRKFVRPLLNAALTTGLLLSGPSFAVDYVQAAGSTLGFSGKYQGEAFNGQFPGFATTLSFDPAKLTGARLAVTIPLATATTRNADYDSELRGVSFFNSKKFPQAHYTATKFRALGGNKFAADGTLSLRGANKPITLTFTWTAGVKPVLAGTAVVKRLDFGVRSGDWADVGVIPNDIKVTTKVVLQPK